MPPHSELATIRGSTIDFPIFPLLAPRLFRTWPRNTRRAHSRAAPAQQEWGPATSRSCSHNLRREPSKEPSTLRKLQTWKPISLHTPIRDGSMRNYEEPSRDDVEPTAIHRDNHARKDGHSGVSDGERDHCTMCEETQNKPRSERPPNSLDGKIGRAGSVEKAAEPITAFRASSHDILDSKKSRHASQEGPWNVNKSLRASQQKSSSNWEEMVKWAKIKAVWERWKGLRRKKRCREGLEILPTNTKNQTKFVRITRSEDYGCYSFCNSWNWRFCRLNSRYDTYMREIRQVSYKVPAYKHPRLSRQFLEDLLEARSKGLVAEKWKILSPRRRKYFWFDVVLKFLDDHPRHALEILKATFIQPYPPGYAIADSLDYMVSHFLSNPDSSFAEGNTILNAFDYFLTIGPKDHVHFFQRTIYRSMGLLDAQNLEKLYSTFVAADHPLHENTLLQLGTQLAKLGKLKTACQILQQLKDQGCDFGASKIMSFCSTLLRQTTQDETGEIHSTVMFILGAGLKPNINIYNILLQNELRIGEQEAAWELHDTMIKGGVPPDEYTYSLLLNHSKLRMDPSGMRMVIEYIRRCDMKNSVIITDIMHAILLLHQQEREHLEESCSPTEKQQPAFDRLLPVYCDHFQVEPLARIIPEFANRYPSLDKTRGADSQALLKDPPGPTLMVMITAFLDGIQTSLPVKQFYDQFRVLVSNQDPVVAPLMQTTHLWNLVLISFSNFPERLGDCSVLIKDMLSPPDSKIAAPASRSLNEKSDGVGSQPAFENGRAVAFHGPSSSLPSTSHATFSPPKPDVFTWSILIKIFMGLRQPRAAEKIVERMRQTGVEPSKVTWNKLVDGYANLQRSRGAVSAVARLENAGMHPDEFTFTSLSKIKYRPSLIRALKEMDSDAVAAEIAFVRDLKDDLKYLEGKVPEYTGGGSENDTWFDDLFAPKEE